MGTQKLYQISFSSADAKAALKTLIPAMESGFNVNTHRGDFSVSGEDAAAVAEFLAERIKARLAAEKQAAKGKEQPAVVTREQARFMGFNTDTALGKYTAIVKLEEGMSDRDARSDAISLMRASFGGVSAVRVGHEARLLAEIPEGAWEDKNCSGWGWMAKGHLPEPGAENRLAGFVLVTLENTQTAAFADIGRNSEIKRILLEAAERVRVDGVGAGFALHDANGNAVGRVERVDSVPREPVEVSSGANGRVRIELDLRRDAFQGEAGPNAQIAASITTAAEKIAAAGAEGGFLLNAPDGDVLGGVGLNRLPDGDPDVEKKWPQSPSFVFVTLENTQTAAFADIGRNTEIKRILNEAADRVLAHGLGNGFDLHDVNGNVIGRVEPHTDSMIEPLELPPGGIRVGLDLSSAAFDDGINRDVDIAAAIDMAAKRFDVPGAGTHFLLVNQDGVVMGAVGQSLPDDPERAPAADDSHLAM